MTTRTAQVFDAVGIASLDGHDRDRGTKDAAVSPVIDALPVPSATDTPDRKRGPSLATQIVQLAHAAGVELWHDGATQDAFATVPVGGHSEHHALTSRAFREWLARLTHMQLGKVPGSQALEDARATLAGQARFDGAAHDVAVRVGVHDGRVYLDLADADWRAVEIDASGWRIVTNPPVRFRRPKGMLPLPMPTAGGSLDALRALAPAVEDRDWCLLVGWLVGTLAPSGPFPVLALVGEQGTGKSSLARALRGVVDPAVVPLRGAVRDPGELVLATRHGRIIALDNLSRINVDLSDELARLATGAGSSRRQLYTDDDEVLTQASRPILLTSIPLVIEGGDLLDRAIVVRLPVIPPAQRRAERDLLAQYELARPSMLGAVCDAASTALRHRASVMLPRLPRMADHAVWVTAAESALGWPTGRYLDAFDATCAEAVEQHLADDEVAARLRAYLNTRGGTYVGSAADLLAALTPSDRAPQGWPKTPRKLTAELDRLAPFLRRVGVDFRRATRSGTTRGIIVTTVTTVITFEDPRETNRPTGDGVRDGAPRPSAGQSPKSTRNDSGGDGGDGLCRPHSRMCDEADDALIVP